MTICKVCTQTVESPLYISPCAQSVTTMFQVLPTGINVYFCTCCGHLQTDPLSDLSTYYKDEYRILADSEEEDQLYALAVDGCKTYRTEHQVTTLLQKISIPQNAKVLDYGCAKASTLRSLLKQRPDIDPYCFDVSDLYLPFWRRFVPSSNWATHNLNPEWRESFDLVISSFALEHVDEPRQLVERVAHLLKPGGYFYLLVPNVYTNSGDFIVADHVSHFSRPSLQQLLSDANLCPISFDDTAHTSAWVVLAKKVSANLVNKSITDEIAALAIDAAKMAVYWRQFGNDVRTFEEAHANYNEVAIYGSGFYGTNIAASLKNPEKITCFLDQNPFRQTQRLLGKKILPPELLPRNIKHVYVGLNPKSSREVMRRMSLWTDQTIIYFYPREYD